MQSFKGSENIKVSSENVTAEYAEYAEYAEIEKRGIGTANEHK